MLSGVGPIEELGKHGIKAVHELPHLGRNLQDHCFSSVGIVYKREVEAVAAGDQQSPTPMVWFKLPSVISSPEHSALSPQTKEFLSQETVPSVEVATHTPPALASYTPSVEDVAAGLSFLGIIYLVMNPQSRGVSFPFHSHELISSSA
jgi:hypothetical protein